MLVFAALISVSSKLGYLLPAIIGLESMGIPSPGETALVAAAVLASQGKLEIWLVIVIGIASAIVGDNIGYALGRRFGREVLEAPGPWFRRRLLVIRAGDQFFQKHGGKAVFLARWVALVRVAAAWLAGINRMPFRRFFLWNALGGITWGITFGLAGYFLGKSATRILSQVGIAGAIVLVLMLVGGYVALRRRERRMTDPERPAADQDE
jgi:membrane protein DedA with SNARE-associated domain